MQQNAALRDLIITLLTQTMLKSTTARLHLRSVLVGLSFVLVPSISARAQMPLREWKVSAAPLLTIGGDGAPKTEFFRIRGAWRMQNGSIVVVDGSTVEFRVFDAGGKFSKSFGRKGAGPGEFEGITWSTHVGDTAVVYDDNIRRITFISFAGVPRVLRQLSVRGDDERGFDIAGRLRDGRWAAHKLSMPNLRLGVGAQTLTGSVGLLDANASGAVNWLPAQPDLTVLLYNSETSKTQISVQVAAFATSLAVATTESSIWFGNTASDSLVRLDVRSNKRSIVRLPDPPIALTDRVISAAREQDFANARTASARSRAEIKYEARNLPKTQPVFDELIPGFGEELWVKRSVGERSASNSYVVLGGEGQPVARVAVPPRFRITDVGKHYVVGVHQDVEGVEFVRVYSLVR